MPGGTWSNNFKVYTGNIYQPTSAPLTNYDPSRFSPGSAAAGSVTITYTDANNAVLNYSINESNGIGLGTTTRTGQKAMTRQLFGAVDNQPRLQINDLWWAGQAENGWGINIAQQGRTVFAIWYTYGADGKATWLALQGDWQGNTYSGPLYTTVGAPWAGRVYDPGKWQVAAAGSMSFNFSDANNATMTYKVNAGVAGSTATVIQTKTIVRQPF